ncbi:MAG: hypothetical protein JXN65_03545 [Clostridia bacterium]|nr:hypothetical protein [Clostridia bacterium]
MTGNIIITLLLFLLKPLLITIIIECGIVFLLFRKGSYVYYVLLLNVLTNPLLNFIMLMYFSYMGYNGYYGLLYFLEAAVVIIEGLIFSKLTGIKAGRALLVSLILNAASYGAGLLIFR